MSNFFCRVKLPTRQAYGILEQQLADRGESVISFDRAIMWKPAIYKASEGTREALADLVASHEEWLIERILHYATLHDFTRYTSTLKEAWRASIEGLSRSLLALLDQREDIPEFGPDEDWLNDPCGEFGRLEAEKHRNRGITLAMFLGLMKYYRQCYLDLLRQQEDFAGDPEWAELFIQRFFDRIEISFGQCWSGIDTDALTNNLQQQNRLLANEKNKFHTLFESYSMPCFLVDDSGSLDCMNLSATRVFGYGLSPGEHYYRAEKEESVPDWLADDLAQFSASRLDEDVYEKTYQRNDNERIFVVHFKRMLDVSGKFSGVVVSLADVTRRVQDKLNLERAHAELQQAQDALVQREKMASIGRLSTGMAHEINNPLAVILQNLQVVERRLQPDLKRNQKIAKDCDLDFVALQEYLDRQQIGKMHESIKDSGCRAAAIVSQLSSFNRKGGSAAAMVDVRALLDRVVSSWQENNDPCRQDMLNQVEIRREYAEELVQVRGNELELRQVLLTLLENAALAFAPSGSGEESVLVLRAYQQAGDVVLEVEDNGCGMTEEECQHIFEPFYTTREPGKGLGLGLTMASKIVQRYAGQIGVVSAPGKGSAFTITFPAAADLQDDRSAEPGEISPTGA